jgi:PKD repeat protein/pimeloyl-ACP methyl ester carboxylesterase
MSKQQTSSNRIRQFLSLGVLLALVCPLRAAAAASCQHPTQTMVSVDPAGDAGGNDDSAYNPTVSASGTFVAFTSSATNLVTPPVSVVISNIFVRDMAHGTTSAIETHAPNSSAAWNQALDGVFPVLSAWGRYAMFNSGATNIVNDKTNFPQNDAYLDDLLLGQVTRVTVPDSSVTLLYPNIHDSAQGGWASSVADSGAVAFISSGTVFTFEWFDPNHDWEGSAPNIYVRDGDSTSWVTKTTLDSNQKPEGLSAFGVSLALGGGVLTSAGTTLVFSTNATNLRGFESSTPHNDLYVATGDAASGWNVLEHIVTISNRAVGLTGSTGSYAISPGGRWVAYIAQDGPQDPSEVYVWDRSQVYGLRKVSSLPLGTTTHQVSNVQLSDNAVAWHDTADYTGEGAGAYYLNLYGAGGIKRIGRELFGPTPGAPADTTHFTLSADGRYAAFATFDPYVTSLPTNGKMQVYLEDMETQASDCPVLSEDVLNPLPFVKPDGRGIYTDPATIASISQFQSAIQPMRGLSADGVSQLLVRAIVPSAGVVTFQAVDPSDPQNLLHSATLQSLDGASSGPVVSANTVALLNGKYAAFVVVPPIQDFVRPNSSSDGQRYNRSMDVIASFSASGGVIMNSRNITIMRPPLALIHGLWSSSSTWATWSPIAALSKLVLVDYKDTHSSSFATNVPIVAAQVTQAIRLRNEHDKIMTGRVDVIAHSMGAVLVRHWAANTFNSDQTIDPYLNIESYLSGAVHKMVMVNSPQWGADTAQALIAALSPSVYHFFHDIDLCALCGAIHDLQANKPLTSWAQATSMPVFSMVGNGPITGDHKMEDLRLVVTAALFPLPGYDSIYGKCPNDGIVAAFSQQAGLPASAMLSYSGVASLHTNVLADPIHENDAAVLIDQPTSTFNPTLPTGPTQTVAACWGGVGTPPYSAPPALPVPEAAPGSRAESSALAMTAATGGIAIASPAQFAAFQPGQQVTMTIAPVGSFVPAQGFAGTSLGDLVQLSGSPLTGVVTIPTTATGAIDLTALAFDAAGNAAVASAIRIYADPGQALGQPSLKRLHFDRTGGDVLLTGSRPIVHPRVLGEFADQVLRELRDGQYYDNGAVQQLTFTSSDTTTATVNAKGWVTGQDAKAAGATATALITVSAGTLADTMGVFVSANPAPPCATEFLQNPPNPGCLSPYDVSDFSGLTQCDDRVDNNGNGLIDMDEPTCMANGRAWDHETAPPVPAFTAACTGPTCTFDARLSTSNGVIHDYAWTFGDGGGGGGALVSHAYAGAGTYTATLQVTDFEGQVAQTSQAVTVYPPPAAGFTFQCSGLLCSFDGSSSTPAGDITTYSWSFGDAASGLGIGPSHAFAAKGSYQVTLTVTDSALRQSTASKWVTVTSDLPLPAESYFALPPCRILDTRNAPYSILNSGQPVTFQITGSCGIPATAKAVSLTVTAVSPTGPGWMELYPGGQAGVKTTINFDPARASTRAANTIVQLATTGAGTLGVQAGITASPGQVHLILDVDGYFSEDTAAAPGAQGPLGYQTIAPCRLASGAPVSSGAATFTAQGACGIPSGAAAAALNATIAAPTNHAVFVLYESSLSSTPGVSNLDWDAGISALANGARPTLAATTPDLIGRFSYAPSGTTASLNLDAAGYFKSGAPYRFHPIAQCGAFGGSIPAGTTSLQIQGNCGVPVGAKAAFISAGLFAPTTTTAGTLQIFPAGGAANGTSFMSYDPGETGIANGAIVQLSNSNADLSVYSSNSVTLIVKVFGYFDAAPPPPAPPAAGFTFECSGLACSFDGSGSTPANALTAYSWSFGDAASGSGIGPSHAFAAKGIYTVTLTVTDNYLRQSTASKVVTVTSDPPLPAESYFALPPCRILDTRNAPYSILISGQAKTFQITGSCGIPATAKAVSLTATAVSPTGQGYMDLYPGDQAGTMTMIRFDPARASTRSTSTIVQLATTGAGTLGVLPGVTGSPGQVHLILDVDGYFSEDATAAQGARGPLGYQTITPCRIASGAVSSQAAAFTVQGSCGIPSGAAAAALNATIAAPTNHGVFVLYESSLSSTPGVSNLDWDAGISALANGARPTLAAATPDLIGRFSYAPSGTTASLNLDAAGYFKSGAPYDFHPLAQCVAFGGSVAAGVTSFQIQGNCGVPVGAKAAFINVTLLAPSTTTAGTLQVFPAGGSANGTSFMSYDSGETGMANGAIVQLSNSNADLSIYSSNNVTLIVKVYGYFQ